MLESDANGNISRIQGAGEEQVDSLGAAPPRSAGVEEAPEGIEATPADVGEEVTAAPVLIILTEITKI